MELAAAGGGERSTFLDELVTAARLLGPFSVGEELGHEAQDGVETLLPARRAVEADRHEVARDHDVGDVALREEPLHPFVAGGLTPPVPHAGGRRAADVELHLPGVGRGLRNHRSLEDPVEHPGWGMRASADVDRVVALPHAVADHDAALEAELVPPIPGQVRRDEGVEALVVLAGPRSPGEEPLEQRLVRDEVVELEMRRHGGRHPVGDLGEVFRRGDRGSGVVEVGRALHAREHATRRRAQRELVDWTA